VTPDDYLAAIRSDGDALAAAATANMDRPVPSCPDWTVAELVGHVGWVHRWVEGMVRTRATTRAKRPPVPEAGERLAWFGSGMDLLLDTLGSTAPSEHVWNWSERDCRAGWWQRRMAQETAVHRVDAQLGAGAVEPVAPALAADGVDEWMDIFVDETEAAKMTGTGEIVHLHRTDGDDGWIVTITPEGLRRSRAHPDDPTAVVRATASDLLLLLWRRVPRTSLHAEGDVDLLDRFLATVEL